VAASGSNWVVLKFGGTSVSSKECWDKIRTIVEARKQEGLRPLIVCSAFSKVSDTLERLLGEAAACRHADILGELEKRHKAVAAELGVDFAEAKPYFDELARLVTGISLTREVSPRVRAQVMSFGEMMSTKIGAAYLNANGTNAAWHDARDYLLCDEEHVAGHGKRYLYATCECGPDEDAGRRLGNGNEVVVTQGFIARNSDGETVLLGRGGSDVSAAYFATKLGAARCEIWTDVPGMYTANPRQVPTARLLKGLDYGEAQEIASAGAKVLHPRTIAPVRAHKIPLHIRSLSHPDVEGTNVSPDAAKTDARVKAISSRGGVTLVSMESVDMWRQVGYLARVFDCFSRHGLSIDLVSTSETNVTVTLDRAANALDKKAIGALVRDLEEFCQVRVVESCAVVSLVGKNIRAILHKIGPAMEVFEEQRIYLVSQAANDLNLTFVVDEDQADKLVRELHAQLFSLRKDDDLLGQTWHELNEDPAEREARKLTRWWQGRKDELIAIAEEETPVYVYDEATIGGKAADLMAMKSLDRVFYSVKANANPDVLRILEQRGLGFECVSPYEIEHVLELFPKIDRERILFTPNFSPKGDYEMAFKAGTKVTLDNIYPLERWPEVFRGREVFVRIDPGEGDGHHKFVKTAGAKSKFGVSIPQLGALKELIASTGVKVVGLHAHVGSNIFSPEKWSNTAVFLAEVASDFEDVKYLDLGGGLGVVEKPGQNALDLRALDDELAKLKRAHPEYELWIEPGRYLVAEAGVLLARVTQTKRKGDYRYVGIDAGMNVLIRPALYGSYHEIVNLSRVSEPAGEPVSIVGPICESGDVLGHERNIARAEDGDVILVDTTGAYGRVMSSNYNMRPMAEERVLKKRR
jgi:diaminopimelate decarboxylase/aspartate kinase